MSLPSDDPRMDMPAQRFSALLIVLLSAAIIWLLDVIGLCSLLDGLAYDFFLQRARSPQATPSTVLLVEWDENLAVAQPEAFTHVLTILQTLGADQIVFAFMPKAPSSFYRTAVEQGNVLFGRPLIADADNPDEMRLAPLPSAAADLPLVWGVVHRPPTDHGMARQQRACYFLGSECYPALEVAAASQRLAGRAPLPDSTYGVGFRGGPGSIPHVSLHALLAGRLVPELVQGRTVLLGKSADFASADLFTPPAPNGPPMSLLEFQGHALDSLLLNRTIRTVTPVSRLLLFLLAGGLSALVCRWLGSRLALWAALLLLAGWVFLTWLLLRTACWWLPLVGLLAAQLLFLFIVFWQETIFSHGTIKRLLLRSSSSLRDQRLGAGFSQVREHWPLVVNLVTQALDLNRLVFLEAVAGSRQVREAATWNCAPQDILEKQRDYRCSPYCTALEARRPVRIEHALSPFFRPGPAEEHQYLVPLVVAGNVLGFWALAVSPAAAMPRETFEALLTDYADQIAELLQRRLAAKEAARRSWWRVLLPRGEGAHDALSRTVGTLEQRLSRGERQFADSSTPTLVYDLFGRVQQVNAAMLAYLRNANLVPQEMPTCALIAALTGKDLDFARQCLRHVLHEDQRLVLPVQAPRSNDHFLLRLYALPAKQEDTLYEAAPFRIGGICCELLDRTAQAQLHQLKEQLSGRLGVHLRNDLAAIEMSASLLAEEDLAADERAEMAQVLYGKVEQVVDTLTSFQHYLSVDVPGETDRLPVDAFAAFQAALEAVGPLVKAQGVEVCITRPELMSYVLASPNPLRQFFEHILAYLIRDARPNGQVNLRVEETEPVVSYVFANTGFGSAANRLQEYLFGTEALTSEEFKHLRSGVGDIQRWGGRVEAESKPGEGTFITVLLPRFG